MAKSSAKKPSKKTATGDLTMAEIQQITDQLVVLREKLRLNGATALTPTAEWTSLRKEIALLNKNLNEDAAAKRDAKVALEAGSQPPVPSDEHS